jgi:hypothetical protein
MDEIQTDWPETLAVQGRATESGGAHIFVLLDDEVSHTVTLTVPQVKALRKALKKAAGL